MKRIFTIIAVLSGCILFSGCEKKENYTVTGRLISYIEGEVLNPTMVYMPSHKENKTLVVKDDLFQFHGKISADSPGMAFVEYNDVSQWLVFLEPGDIILDEKSRCAMGTPLNDAHRKCESRINRLTIKQGPTMLEDIKAEYGKIITEHKDDLLGAYYLSECFSIFSSEEVDAFINNAGPGFKDSDLFKTVYPELKAYLEERDNATSSQTESSDE